MPDPLACSAHPTKIAVAIVRHAAKVLIGRRPQGVALAGLWEFPGGKVEPGEDPVQAAARECLEETGLAVEVRGAISQRRHSYAYGDVHLFFFDCRPQNPAQQPAPPFIWAAIDDLANYEFPPANDEVLARLAQDEISPLRSLPGKPL